MGSGAVMRPDSFVDFGANLFAYLTSFLTFFLLIYFFTYLLL